MNQLESCCRQSVDTFLIESAKDILEAKEKELKEKSKIFALLGNKVHLKMMTVFLNVAHVCDCDLSE